MIFLEYDLYYDARYRSVKERWNRMKSKVIWREKKAETEDFAKRFEKAEIKDFAKKFEKAEIKEKDMIKNENDNFCTEKAVVKNTKSTCTAKIFWIW